MALENFPKTLWKLSKIFQVHYLDAAHRVNRCNWRIQTIVFTLPSPTIRTYGITVIINLTVTTIHISVYSEIIPATNLTIGNELTYDFIS